MGRNSKYDASFRAKVAIEAIREDRPPSELVKEHNVARSVIESWKAKLLTQAFEIFENKNSNEREQKQLKAENDRLIKKISQLTIEKDHFRDLLRSSQTKDSLMELESKRPSSMSRRRFCAELGLTRSNLYYVPKGESEENMKIMDIMAQYHTDHSTAGVRTMVNVLALNDISANHKRVRRLMKLMGIIAIRKKHSADEKTDKKAPASA